MYHTIINGVQHSMERLRYIKLQSNGLFVSCGKEEAQGITVDGENYALQGNDIGLPVIHVFWSDDVEKLVRENEALKEQNAFLEQCISEIGDKVYELE